MTPWVSCDFGGEGGETYYRVPPPKPFLEASESGICLVCAGFENDMTGTNGGGKRIIGGGGPKTFKNWGAGFYGMFSPSPEFSTPPLFLMIEF